MFSSAHYFIQVVLLCTHMVEKNLQNTIQNDHQPSLPDLSPGESAAHHITDISGVTADISIESVCRYFGGNKYRPDKSTIRRVQHGIDEAAKLVSPQATYRLYNVTRTIQGEKIILEEGTHIGVPDCFEASGTHMVGVVIGTLGDGLEKHCRQLAADNQVYQSTLLDAIGTTMLDLLSEHVSSVISDCCSRYGLTAGSRFAPGIDGYPLEQQKLLFKLADSTSVGVSLNSSTIMTPTKSISFFQTLTPQHSKQGIENKCSRCRLVNCQFRIIREKTKQG